MDDRTIRRRDLLVGGGGVALGAVASWAGLRLGAPEVEAGTFRGGMTEPWQGEHQAGIVTPPQGFLNLTAFDLRDGVDRVRLGRLMRIWTDDISRLAEGRPGLTDTEPELAVHPARLTVTVGFGPGMFERAGMAADRPAWLAQLPPYPIDRLETRWSEGDLVLQVCAEDPSTVAHAARLLAKEAADFVLMEHSLAMVRQGIQIGRRTFANTIKYIFITTSANFGNMISMAAGSLFLPFLPLLAKQVLLNNFMSDIPSVGIAGDRVDPEWEREPHRWNIRIIRDFMVIFGLVSTAFDLLTFYALIRLAGSAASAFRTGWFIESLLTELLVLFVVRTYRPFYRSRPGTFILASSALLGLLAVALPYLPAGRVFGFVPLPWPVLAAVLAITLLYLVVSESTKRAFFRFLRL